MTPRSWEHWIPRFERRGYRVLAPAYPGFDVEVEALRADASPIERVTVPETVEHLGGRTTAPGADASSHDAKPQDRKRPATGRDR